MTEAEWHRYKYLQGRWSDLIDSEQEEYRELYDEAYGEWKSVGEPHIEGFSAPSTL